MMEKSHLKRHELLEPRVLSIVGWLRVVGSFKLWVSFAKEPYERDDILQKRRVILRTLLIETTPCHITKHMGFETSLTFLVQNRLVCID